MMDLTALQLPTQIMLIDTPPVYRLHLTTLLVATKNTQEVCVGVVKGAKIFPKNPA